MPRRYAWFGKLLVAICLIIAVSLGSGVGLAKKKPKAKVIPQEKAKLVLQVRGLTNSGAIFMRQEAAGDTTEIGLWRSPSGAWPAAWLTLTELHSDYQFIEGPPLQELLGASFQSGVGPSRAYYGLPQIVGEQGEFTNHLGTLEFQRFTLGTGIPCVGMRQYVGSIEPVNAANSPLGDTMVFGWYCAAPDEVLSDDMVTMFLRGIGVKGIGLPPAPIMSSLTSEGTAPAYKIAIFPFETDDKCVGQIRLSDDKFANQLGALITSNNSLTLAYSHYDKYLNHPPIKRPGRLWKGSKPNLAQVISLGETRRVDAVVMYWRATSTGGVYCTDRMPPFPIDVYVIDVQQRKTYKLNGREENISALAEQVLSRFLAGRQ